MQTWVKTISVIIVALALTHLPARGTDFAQASYWNRLTGKQLLEKAEAAMRQPDMKDSATLYYSILANRYYGHTLKDGELSCCVQAMTNLGYLYCSTYADYQKSYEYLQEALKLAKANGFVAFLPYIYLNLGVLSGTYEELGGLEKYSKETMSYLEKAFSSAVSAKQWKAVIFSLCNLVDTKIEYEGSVTAYTDTFAKLKIPRSTPLFLYAKSMCQGVNCYYAGNYPEALKHFKTMQLIAAKEGGTSSDMLRFRAINYQAKALLALGKGDETLLQTTTRRGLNIIRMSDGSTRKIVLR